METEEEEIIVKTERRLVGRKHWEYPSLEGETELKVDTGFGKAGAKLDPSTGAMKYDKYEDYALKKKIRRPIPEPEPRVGLEFSADSYAIIHIKEDEEASLDANGDLLDLSATGIVSVRNLSETDRLWDIDVSLNEESGVAIVDFNNIYATELEPKTKVSKNYKIRNYAPSIMLKEVISTHPEYPESVILNKGKPTHVLFEINIKNVTSIPYKNIILKKSVPKELKNIKTGEGVDESSVKDEILTWRLDELNPGELRILRFEGDMEPSLQEIPIGIINLEAVGQDTITKFVFTEYNAMCRNMYFIEADETDEPGVWMCRFVCDNTSSFEVEILKVQVRDSGTNQMYLNLTNPKIKVPPNQTWESEPWIVEGKDRPSFIKTLVLNVIPGLSTEMNYKLSKKSGVFRVGSLAFTKTFDKDKAIAGRITDLVGKLVIENVGSAALEHLVVRDLFPKYMEPPQHYWAPAVRLPP